MRGVLVCFAAAFRLDGSRGGEESQNITHAVAAGSDRTLCGRSGWLTTEDVLGSDPGDPRYPDCLRCARSLERMRRLGGDS